MTVLDFPKSCRAQDPLGWEYSMGTSALHWAVAPVCGRKGVDEHVDKSAALRDAIHNSSWILDLEDDWDQDGAARFSEDTWWRAAHFLLNLAADVESSHGVSLRPPRILPAAQGAIALHWKTDTFELLATVPENPAAPLTYYGDDTRELMPIESQCGEAMPDRKLVAWMGLFD